MATEKRKIIELQADKNGVSIQSTSEIVSILNPSITTGAWTEIKTPVDADMKSFYAKMRDGSGFKISTSAAGATYITFSYDAAMDIVKGDDETLFYVQAETTSGVFEIALLR